MAIDEPTLYFLMHPGTDLFSGYGLSTSQGSKEHLVGFLMVDRPGPVDPDWLDQVEAAFGGYKLYPMTQSGARGIACRMQIEEESLAYVREIDTPWATAAARALAPLLAHPPAVVLGLRWDGEARLWRSEFLAPTEQEAPVVARKGPLFSLGQVVATPGALAALAEAGQEPIQFLYRHATGDWGDLDEHDVRENERAVMAGYRILSAYWTQKKVKIWVITEWDRSVTTLLLPEEY